MERILYNGAIFGGKMQNEVYSAMYIKQGVIIALGSDEDILSLRTDPAVQTENLSGKYVFPGFVDSHIHFLDSAHMDSLINLHEAKSFDDVKKLCGGKVQWAKNHNKWIQGISFNQDDWDIKKIPTRRDLDQISADVPIVIKRACLHVAVCNTRAMEIMGLLGNSPREESELFDRYEDGVLNGIIREDAQTIINEAMPPLTKEEIKAFIISGCRKAAATGITEIQTDDFHSFDDDGELVITAYKELAHENLLSIRIYEQNYLPDKGSLERFLARGRRTGDVFGLFRIGPLKVVMDGSLGAHSAYMRKPYVNDPSARGICYHDAESLYELYKTAHDNGMQIATHCIGDGALDRALEGYRRIQWENPRPDPRHGIIHCQIMDDHQTEAFKKLGLLGYIQPIFLRCDMNIVDDCVGAELGRQSYNWRKLTDLGVHISGGSDCPVEAFDIMPNLQYAVTRKNPDTGKSWYPENGLSIGEAMRAFTYEGAYASFAERVRGSVEIGKLADLVVLSDSPYATDPESLCDIQVLETIVNGKTVFKAGE